MTDDGAENYVKDIVSGEWHLFDSASKELTEENCTLEKTSFFFERMVDGVPVNYIRNSYLPYDELSRPWIDEDDNFHEAKCDVWQQQHRGKSDSGVGFLWNLEFPGTGLCRWR